MCLCFWFASQGRKTKGQGKVVGGKTSLSMLVVTGRQQTSVSIGVGHQASVVVPQFLFVHPA